jgi:hypothetical protein
MTTPFEIFICYRRNRATVARTLYDRLQADFGDTVFIDHEGLEPIEPWRGQINAVTAGCVVMVAVLADDWLSEVERRHWAGTKDEVIRELAGALDAGVPILPVYVDGARSPRSEDLAKFPAESPVFRALSALSEPQAMYWQIGSRDKALDALAEVLAGRLRRFDERLVGRCQARLAQQLAAGGADPWPLKFRHFGRALQRPSLMDQIEAELQTDPGVLLLHAEEGMGKTFVLGEWLRRQSKCATVLADASDPCWRRGFLEGLQALLLEANPRKAELKLALAQPLWIAVDGLNEPGVVDDIRWATLLRDALRLQSEGRPWRLIVTVRTGFWEKMKSDQPALKVPSRVRPFEIPGLTLEQAAAVAKSLRFPWEQCSPAVRQQLLKPRLLVSASRLKPEVLEGWELSEGLVMLLDLRQQDSMSNQRLGFEAYCEVLQTLGLQWLNKVAPQRDQLQSLFSDLDGPRFEAALMELRDRELIDRGGSKLAIHERSAELAVALYLVDQLQKSSGSHQVLLERISIILADRQDDFTARVLAHALSAALLERLTGVQSLATAPARPVDPVIAALFLAWAVRFNRNAIRRIPWMRWLLPEFIQLAEAGELRDASHWLALALEWGAPPAADVAALREAINTRWFTTIDLSESWSKTEEDAAERRGYFEQARQRLPSFRDQPRPKLRRIALEVAVRCRWSPVGIDLHALCLSVSVQPMQGWDRLVQWVQASRVDWWPSLQAVWRQIVASGYSPSLHRRLARLVYQLWPTEECRRLVEPALEDHDLVKVRGPKFSPFETPEPEALARTCRRVAVGGLDARPADLAAVALWAPEQMAVALAAAVDHAADPNRTLGFLGRRLSPFVPLLSPAQRLRIRRRLGRPSSEDCAHLDALSSASSFGLPEARRVAATLRQLRVIDLSWRTLEQVRLSSAAAASLVERFGQAPESTWGGRLVFWLRAARCEENAAAIGTALARVIPGLQGLTLPATTERHLLWLADDLGLASLVATLIPEAWSHSADPQAQSELADLRSWTLARSGLLSAEQLRQRCKPGLDIEEPALGATERTRRRIAQTREVLMGGAGETLRHAHIREALEDDPALIRVVIDAGDGDRAATVANVLDPSETAWWLELATLATQRRIVDTIASDDIPIRYHAIFKMPDSADARAVWAKALAKVGNDEELLQLVIAASKGHGRDWLQDLVQIHDAALPHDQIAAATIVAFAGISNALPQIQALLDRSGGWIAKGLARAIERYQSDQHAHAWLERFRWAPSWSEACSSWRFHLEALDLRYQLWKDGHTPCLLPGADSYLSERAEDRPQAARRRAEAYRKTRFGLDLG